MVDFDALVLAACHQVFADAVIYTPVGSADVSVTGIFDNAYREQKPVDDYAPGNITGARPVLGVRLSQFAQYPQQGDLLTIVRTGRSYVVIEVRDDSHGGALLLLNEAA